MNEYNIRIEEIRGLLEGVIKKIKELKNYNIREPFDEPYCKEEHEEALDEQVLGNIVENRGKEWIKKQLKNYEHKN